MLKYTNFLYLILIHFSLKEMERGMNAHWHCMLNMILKFKVIVENNTSYITQ